MTRFFTVLLLTTTAASPTLAQTMQDGFARPSDVPAYVETFNGYEAGTTQNTIGDGSNAWGGTMPVLATQPADIPSTATGWKGTGPSVINIPPATEKKFRSIGNTCFIAPDDPVRNYGAPGTSHLHQFFGNCTVNAYSTYATLRNRANQYSTGTPKKAVSTVAGGPHNATGYWFPCPIKTNPFADGKNYCVKADRIIIYYVLNAADPSRARLPRGLRYVLGRNMDDPDNATQAAEIAAANAQPSTAGRYSMYIAGPKNDGFTGWECRTTDGTTVIQTTGAQNLSQFLKTTGGVDPWGGNCLTGYKLTAILNAPECYDGKNLWSPGGYKHFRFPVYDTQSSNGRTCPKGWFKVPILELSISFFHKGFADYGAWRLSSDDAMQAKLTALGTPRAVANGESMHTDWFGAWDDEVFYGNAAGTVQGWQKFCAGVEGNTAHECDSSTFNATNSLIGGYAGENAPDGTRNPQVVQTPNQYDTSVPGGMFQIPPRWAGPATLGNN